MKKTTTKLRLNRETLCHLLNPSALQAAPGGNTVAGAPCTAPVTACLIYTCPPACTVAHPCAG
jgi:hypothetical protein